MKGSQFVAYISNAVALVGVSRVCIKSGLKEILLQKVCEVFQFRTIRIFHNKVGVSR